MAAFVVMLSRLLSTCQQSSASGRYSNRSSALRTHERRGSATITSSDVEKTRLGKLSDDESWSRWNEWIERVGASCTTCTAPAALPDSRAMLCRCGSWPSSSAEVDSVSKRHRSFLLASLLPALLLVGAFAVVHAQEGKSTAAKPARWSDPATWPDRKVPGADGAVTIGRDMNVVLDVSPPALRSLTIEGKLSFADNRDLELTTEWIMLHGELEVGTEAKPHTRKATITLTNNVQRRRRHGHGRPRDHAHGRNPEPAR